ncbi:hypothetical protein LTR85_007418 [Meristemomyces frigidus]|nr:hypothetical protein LTR85_007418 [Meristemomyces frigidus]
MNKRTIKSPEHRGRYISLSVNAGLTTIREVKTFPEQPPLSFVNKQLRGEALAVYFGANTFLFNLNGTNDAEVERWCPMEVRSWTVLLEFALEPMVVSHESLSLQRPATITISLDAEGMLVVKYGGVLAEECTCRLERKAAEVNDIRIRNPRFGRSIGCFVLHVETELKEQISPYNRRPDRFCRCDVCEKICWAPHNIQASH